MNKDLKRFLISSAVVILIVSCLDDAFGWGMNRIMQKTGVTGQIGKINYAINEIKEPNLILGSSRAAHHYDPKILADSIKGDFYNIGVDGCFYSHNLGVLNSMLDRYTPQIIIWEFSPEYLWGDNDNITDLYQYYDVSPYISDLIDEDLTWTENFRIKSNFYKYNSKVHRIIMRYFSHGPETDPLLGYLPLPETINKSLILKEREPLNKEINIKKKERFVSTINRIKEKGCNLILVESPVYYYVKDTRPLEYMNNLCDSLNVPFIDNSQLKEFLQHPEYFKDRTHLNKKGAEVYTKFVASQIKRIAKTE